MKIAEWRKLASAPIDESKPHIEVKELLKQRNVAHSTVDAYEQYKLILVPKHLNALKRFVKRYKEMPEGFFCMYGDCQNVQVQYRGKYLLDFKGEIIDTDPDDVTYVGCVGPHSDEKVVFPVHDFMRLTEEIDEFAEVRKLIGKGYG